MIHFGLNRARHGIDFNDHSDNALVIVPKNAHIIPRGNGSLDI